MRLWPRRHGTSYDLLVAGLGNPGREHLRNRHNVGWHVVDELALRHDGAWKGKFNGKLAEVRIDGHRVALLKPETLPNAPSTPAAPRTGIGAGVSRRSPGRVRPDRLTARHAPRANDSEARLVPCSARRPCRREPLDADPSSPCAARPRSRRDS